MRGLSCAIIVIYHETNFGLNIGGLTIYFGNLYLKIIFYFSFFLYLFFHVLCIFFFCLFYCFSKGLIVFPPRRLEDLNFRWLFVGVIFYVVKLKMQHFIVLSNILDRFKGEYLGL